MFTWISCPVPVYPITEALDMFMKWLKDIGQGVLVGHNFQKFDFPRILSALIAAQMEHRFSGRVH